MSDNVVEDKENYAEYKMDARKHICQGRMVHKDSRFDCITRECNELCGLKKNVKHFLRRID